MKSSFIVSAVLASLAAAVPLNKRETTTEEVLTTVWTTVTVVVDPQPSTKPKGAFFEKPNDIPAKATSSAIPPPVTSSSVPAPTVSPPAVKDVGTDSTPAPAQPQVAPPAAGNQGSPSAGNYPYTGEITYYDLSVGLGSCGTQGSNDQPLVAIASDTMGNGANSNANPNCGKTINIFYEGRVTQAKVHDTCPTCSGADLDLSPSLFKLVAPNGDGRVHGVRWGWAS